MKSNQLSTILITNQLMLTHKMFWLEFIIAGDAMVPWSTGSYIILVLCISIYTIKACN